MAKIQLNARINTKDNTSVTPTIYDTQCMTVGVSFMSILHIDSSVYIHVFEFREVLRLIKCYSLIAALCQCNTKEEVPDNIYSPARLKHLLHIDGWWSSCHPVSQILINQTVVPSAGENNNIKIHIIIIFSLSIAPFQQHRCS